MTPIDFPEANMPFKAPEGMDESQVRTIPTHVHKIYGGNCDGLSVIVVAWQPDAREIQAIVDGAPIYLSCLSLLPPHYLTTSFEEAVNV